MITVPERVRSVPEVPVFVLTVILTLVLALVVAASGVGKLTRAAPVMASMREVRVPDARVPALAAVEIVGAVGLLVGLAVAAIGVLAAAGVLLYFVLAVGAHFRVGKPAGSVAAAVLAVLALVVLVLRATTA